MHRFKSLIWTFSILIFTTLKIMLGRPQQMIMCELRSGIANNCMASLATLWQNNVCSRKKSEAKVSRSWAWTEQGQPSRIALHEGCPAKICFAEIFAFLFLFGSGTLCCCAQKLLSTMSLRFLNLVSHADVIWFTAAAESDVHGNQNHIHRAA